MNLIVLTPPPVEPVTLEDIYTFLRLDPDGSPPTHPDDAMLVTMIRSAREKVEQTTRRALVQQSIRMIQPRFPGFRVPFGSSIEDDGDFFFRDGGFDLPRPPFISIDAVTYYDAGNTQQTLDPASYFVTQGELVPQLHPVEGISWPDTFGRGDAVAVDYTVGYPPTGSPPSDFRATIPASLVDAVKFEVQLQYDELAPEKRKDIENTIKRLLRSFVIPRF